MRNRTYGQWGIMVNTADRDGAPWAMDIWAMGSSWLILQIEMGHLGGWVHG